MFNIYIEENNIPYYKREYLRELQKDTAIKWCKENNINYRLK
ncbi:MAG: hypothetical protein U0M12_04950 [Acutalibacteraceae bacterium]|nr:hypothetical protein [Acutalibacteraceae bacterium]